MIDQRIAALLAEIKGHPKFAEACAADPIWVEHFAAIEPGLELLFDHGNDSGEAIEFLDEIRAIVARNDTIGNRLRAIHAVLLRWEAWWQKQHKRQS